MRDFEYLTFDCYGTLIDWETGIVDSISRAAGKLPLPRDRLMAAYLEAEKRQEDDYMKYVQVLKSTFEVLSAGLGIAVSNGAAERFAHSVPDWPAFQDTASSLRRLGELGYRRYILSNVDDDILRATIRAHGLEVDGTVTAEQVRSYKPAPGHWERFFRETGAGRGQVLHVAQSVYHDLVPAKNLGLATAWVNRYREPMPANVAPNYVSDDLQGLVRLLE